MLMRVSKQNPCPTWQQRWMEFWSTHSHYCSLKQKVKRKKWNFWNVTHKKNLRKKLPTRYGLLHQYRNQKDRQKNFRCSMGMHQRKTAQPDREHEGQEIPSALCVFGYYRPVHPISPLAYSTSASYVHSTHPQPLTSPPTSSCPPFSPPPFSPPPPSPLPIWPLQEKMKSQDLLSWERQIPF